MKLDIETRDKMIFGRYRERKYQNGNRPIFSGMTAKTLGDLIAEGYIDQMSHYNDAPLVCEIHSFLQRYPKYTCHGFTTLDGVYIAGVEKGSPADTPAEFQDFIGVFKAPTELNIQTGYCWYK